MSTIKQIVGSASAITVSLNSLASATYVASSAIDNTTNQPLDLLVELLVNPGAVSGNKQAVLFAIASIDGTNYQSGPTSGTTTTDEADLTFIGTLPLNTVGVVQRKAFSVAAAYGGVLPPKLKFVVKNDSGAAFASSGCSMQYSEISATVA